MRTETVIRSADGIGPIAVLTNVELTPPVGASLTIDDQRFIVIEPPEATILSRSLRAGREETSLSIVLIAKEA